MLRLLRRESARDESTYEMMFLGNVITFVIGIPFILTHPPAFQALPSFFVLGVFQIGLPYLLYTMASKHARAIDMTVIPVLEPILNPVWVFLATREFPGMRSVAGGVLLLIVVIMKSMFSIRRDDIVKRNYHGKPFETDLC
jgi:drug/metabolite transporter (DMT)-like permease